MCSNSQLTSAYPFLSLFSFAIAIGRSQQSKKLSILFTDFIYLFILSIYLLLYWFFIFISIYYFVIYININIYFILFFIFPQSPFFLRISFGFIMFLYLLVCVRDW